MVVDKIEIITIRKLINKAYIVIVTVKLLAQTKGRNTNKL